MAITTMNGVASALGTGPQPKIFFPSATNVVAGFVNLNQAGTGAHGLMAAPTAFGSGGTTYNQSTVSTGFNEWAAGSGTSTYLGRVAMAGPTAGTFFIYDLLWACSGFVGNSATAQNVASFSGMPSRNSTGANAQLWIGCSSAIGATGHNVTASYTNQAGTSGRTTVSTAGITSMPANRMYQLPLQSGDTGIQALASITLSISSGTAGNLWAMIMTQVSVVPIALPNVAQLLDFTATGMPLINDESCLLFVNQGSTTSSGLVLGQMTILQG